MLGHQHGGLLLEHFDSGANPASFLPLPFFSGSLNDRTQLEEKVKEKIKEEYKEQVSLQAEKDIFLSYVK
jgi:hypothetical protein